MAFSPAGTVIAKSNVALSRGRYGLAIVGDHGFCSTAKGINPFRTVLDHIEANPGDCSLKVLKS